MRPPTPPASPQPTSPRTISELISARALQFPGQAILGYPSSGTDYVEYTFQELEDFSRQAAVTYGCQLPLRTDSDAKARVVAILGPSNLDYVVTTLALSRLGFSVLFLSTRLAVPAYESLLTATKCDHIVADSAFSKITSALAAQRSNLAVIDVVPQSSYTQSSGENVLDESKLDLDKEGSQISWIIHSSGSTGPPKPIYQTHAAALRNYENNMNMRGFITLPLFHAHGLSSVFRAFTSRQKIYMANASLPLTSGGLLQIMRQHKFEIFYGVPYALKLLSESADGIAALAECSVVMFGGSACPDSLGDLLVDGGVNLISHYGTTETGQLMTSFRSPGDKAWNYVRVDDRLEPYARFERQGQSDVYELVVMAGWPSKVATNREDGSYATKDLFEPHPTIKRAWRYNSRLDDTIVLLNGEKAVPIVMEQALRQNQAVREALIFGNGKAQLGMILIKLETSANISSDAVLDSVWAIIAAQNAQQPGYAQMSREMINVLPADTPYPMTDKGTIIRQAAYRIFDDIIEDTYRILESKASGTRVLNAEEMRQFLREELRALLQEIDDSVLTDDTDLFGLGLDSLQSTRLRARILQEIDLRGNAPAQNVVFDHPTISKLAGALLALRDGAETEAVDVVVEMEALVARYGDFPRHIPQTPIEPSVRTAVVTGATGSLGAHIVAQLVVRDDIDQVVSLVRAGTDVGAAQRVVRSLRERAIWHALPLAARRKIRCYKSDLSEASLGLEPATFDGLVSNVVSVMHCAWSVNFNKNLSSFETDCIAGARNLILLCLSAKQPRPATFNFCSSVSTVARLQDFVPAQVPSFDAAQGMGYAQSKLVTEHIIAKASADTGMLARVLRVGQITADTQHGIWNDTEAIPLMMRAAVAFGAIPSLDETARWLAVDTVAATFIDIGLSSTYQTVFNVTNPNTFHWTEDLIPALAAAGLTFKIVPQRKWIRLLRQSNPDPEVNPTVKLTDFFASKYDNDISRRSPVYDIDNAKALSPALASAPALTPEIVSLFVRHFLKTSWSSTQPKQEPQRLIVVSGPSGCGKSSTAAELAERLGCGWMEGDSIHDAVAIAKMSSGVPLSSLDRQIWLSRIKTQVLERLRAQQMLQESLSATSRSMIITCSALKYEYRQVLRDITGDGSIETVFVMLEAEEEELVRRVSGRAGHYMKAGMVASQVAAIEAPRMEETDVIPVDAEAQSAVEVAASVCSLL